jgi:ribosomal protein L11 methyltransferase
VVALVISGVPRAALDRVSGLLFGAGALGLQEDWLPGQAPAPRQPWDQGPAAPEPDRILVRVWFEQPDRAALEALVGSFGDLRWEDVEDRDWDAEWRAGFGPVQVTDGWVIAPPWDAPPGALLIEPGQGFGTGLHPSTRMALRLMLPVADPSRGGVQPRHHPLRTALDVGCGSGVLALACARLGLEARGIDVEETAIRDARHNAELNGLTAVFGTEPLDELRGTWDLVLANLHAELLIALRDALVARAGRVLVMAGILADREAAVRAAYEGALTATATEREEEWVAIRWER